ncbi:hypothetical protein FOG50_01023 [Hanseniaspora uvarum]|nr:hypothetical protein FOG50_01023 [Hanseniaspora uvarum]
MSEFKFIQSKDLDVNLKINISFLKFYNAQNILGLSLCSAQIVEYCNDYTLLSVCDEQMFELDNEDFNGHHLEFPFLISDISSRNLKLLINIENKYKDNTTKKYSMVFNLSKGQINVLTQGFELYKFNDNNSHTLISDSIVDTVNANLTGDVYSQEYLNKMLSLKLDNLEDNMTFADIENGCNFILLCFNRFEYPVVMNDRVDLKKDLHKAERKTISKISINNKTAIIKNKNNLKTNETYNIESLSLGKNLQNFKFSDIFKNKDFKNLTEDKKHLIISKKPFKNVKNKPLNVLEPSNLIKLLLESLVDKTRYKSADSIMPLELNELSENKNDYTELNWLNVSDYQSLYQVLQEDNQDHQTFKSKIIWTYRSYILKFLDYDGYGMLTILTNFDWNDVLNIPETFLLRKNTDLKKFYLPFTNILEDYDFTKKSFSIEILFHMLRYEIVNLGDNIFQDCIYYADENTDFLRKALSSKILQYIHENFTIKIMASMNSQKFKLYLLHIVEGVCFDLIHKEYIEIIFEESEDSEDEHDNNKNTLEEEFIIDGNKITVPKSITLSEPEFANMESPLGMYLINKGVSDFLEVGNYLYWYLKVQLLYHDELHTYLKQYSDKLTDDEYKVLDLQQQLIDKIDMANKTLKTYIAGTYKNMDKNKYLAHLINSEINSFIKDQNKIGAGSFLRLPIKPDYKILKVNESNCRIFKSSLQPVKLSFTLQHLKNNSKIDYSVIYKNGDDLKQDQLISNIIKIMDSLLIQDNVDLSIRAYDILPMGLNIGFIEFIESDTVSNILSKDGNIKNFLQKTVYENSTEIFIKSTAAYSIITYLLGVGDRHLENLLITPKGEFFHADFGYILGNDPKIFPPLMKLPPQIVEGFGGNKNENLKYDEFRGYCFACFTILRRNSGLLIDLFKYIDLNSEPLLIKNKKHIENTPQDLNKNINILRNDYHKFIEKFQLELDEDEAILYMQNLINSSINAFLPLVIDHLHNLAQYWRN